MQTEEFEAALTELINLAEANGPVVWPFFHYSPP
jgi:hypothetical protein